jgi:hypothetical protein
MTSFGNVKPASRFWRGGRIAASIAVTGIVLLVAGPAGAQTGNGGFPFATGELTAISGSTLEVEGFTGTSKVIVTSQTKYRTTATTDVFSITKGACVRVSGTGDTSEGITATSIAIQDGSQACNQSMQGPGRFPGGQGNQGGEGNGSSDNRPSPPAGQSLPNGGSLPNGASPGDRPSGGFAGGGVIGKVAKVRDGSIVVTARVPSNSGGAGDTSSDSNSNAMPKLKKQKVTVTLGNDVAVTQPVEASRSDLQTGVCVTARGKTDSVGTVTATNVMISQPQDGQCGFGGFGGFGPGGGTQSGTAQS